MPKSKLILNATVIDVEAGVARSNRSILIRDGRIEAVSENPSMPQVDHIDAAGAYVCPGLIDAHVHLFLDAGSSPRLSFLSSDDESKLQTAARNAALALSAGITTVRDCGAPAALMFRFQQSAQRGQVKAPRILAAGSPLTRPGGHCHFFGIEVVEPADVRRAVDSQVRQGAAFVKVIASGGGLTPGTSPGEADLPMPLLREAVAAARANGVHVAAHCHAVESISRALDAGVDTIEHASFVRQGEAPRFDVEIAARIRDQGVVVTPTAISGVRIAQAIRESGPQNAHDPDALVRLEARRLHTARFCEAGVRMVAGTDCGVANTPFDSLVDELLEYQNAGMTPAGALRTATCDSARYFRQPQLGRVEAGSAADLLFLTGNPLDSLQHLRKPLLVIQEGEIVCDFRPAPGRTV